MKRILALILSVLMLVGIAVPASAEEETNPRLYSFYGNNMLFEQKEDAVFAGTASAGTEIKCSLIDETNAVVAQGASVAGNDGIFEVSFDAPKGDFCEYSVVFTADGVAFSTLTGVTFGELWLASGQSNMMLSLSLTEHWQEMQNSGVYGSRWVRILMTPAEPNVENVKGGIPNEVQDDLTGCYWLRADDSRIGEASGVAFYYADELMKKINMPVGVLGVSLGGSSIRSWISRDLLENSDSAMKVLKNHDSFISSKNWYKDNRSYYTDMGSNYNAKIYPLRRFNISGFVWYQGETELLNNYTYGEYTVMMDLLQQNFTRCFSYSKGSLPFVYTQLACFNYRMENRHLQAFNAELADICQKSPESRAVTTIYDISLDFDVPISSIHPKNKEPVGRRLAAAAEALVYGGKSPACAASLKSSRTEGNSIYMTFSDVGDGLVCDGTRLYDFAICGKNGIYYSANAELVSSDTVRVWRDDISKPVSATYAFSQANCRANLWSAKDGEKYMPVSPCVTDRSKNKLYYYDMPWTDCEQEKYWRNASKDEFTGFYDLWDAENCSYSLSSSSAYSGTAGLQVNSKAGEFSLSEKFITENEGNVLKFNEVSRKWSKYGAISFQVRNCGKTDVTLNCAKIETSNGLWFAPEINGNSKTDVVIPSDGRWHKIELDLNELYLFGDSNTIAFGSYVLDEVSSFSLCFNGKSDACFDLDSFDFSPDTTIEQHFRFNFIERAINTLRLIFNSVVSYVKTKAAELIGGLVG